MAHRIDGLPGDQHGHDCSFARAGGQLQRQTHEFRVRVVVRVGEMVEKAFANPPGLRGNLSQPNNGFRRFHLAEERADTTKVVLSPMLKETSRLGSDLPLIWLQSPPLVHMLAQFVDDRRRIILLCGGR